MRILILGADVRDVYAWTTKGYEERVTIRKEIFKNPADSQVRNYLTSLNRPVYLFIEEGYSYDFLKEVEVDRIPKNFDKKNPLVFHNDKQRVYNINFSK